jgi:general secretion pathway protein E
VDIRVSTVPTIFGERIVLRLLDRKQGIRPLSEIGFSERDNNIMEQLLNRSNGIILVTGPTGSGKTTTLYAALSRLNRQERNLITIEDPIEYQLTGVGQIQVHSKINLTFAAGLRAVLRQDPDVIMVGEIRDAETAEIAMQASLTGHLVLSTLHTNDSATAITRLIDMGIEPFMVASSIAGILAQRLVRTICPHCKESYRPEERIEGLPELLYRGKGCERCFGQGTLGRIGIYELLPIDAELCGMITRRAAAGEIKAHALSRGMRTLRDDGMVKVAQGITTLEEVLRVTQEEYADLSL